MAFFECHFFSDVLGMTCAANVIVPQPTTSQIGMTGGERRGKYPTLYLLHGLSDDHTIWMRRTSIERYAAAKSLAVVMPGVGRSFYQDTAGGARYWSFLSEELPNLMQSFFPLSDKRADTFAAGLSMGGYGALRLGLGKPDRFAAAASLSGALDVSRRCREAGRAGSRISRAEMEYIFGPQLSPQGTASDLWALTENLATSGRAQPALFLACGTEDELLRDTREFHQHLDRHGIEHTYSKGPGTHEWGYWDEQIQQVIEWLPLGASPAGAGR